MNRIDFGNGFHLSLEAMSNLQGDYQECISNMAGGYDNCILWGCNVSEDETTVSDGAMVIAGEVVSFVGGAFYANVIVDKTTKRSNTYSDGISKDAGYVSVAKCDANGTVSFNSLKRLAHYYKRQETGWLACTIANGFGTRENGTSYGFADNTLGVLKCKIDKSGCLLIRGIVDQNQEKSFDDNVVFATLPVTPRYEMKFPIKGIRSTSSGDEEKNLVVTLDTSGNLKFKAEDYGTVVGLKPSSVNISVVIFPFVRLDID